MTTLHTGRCALCGEPAALDAPYPRGTCGACRADLRGETYYGGCAVFLFFAAVGVGLGVML